MYTHTYIYIHILLVCRTDAFAQRLPIRQAPWRQGTSLSGVHKGGFGKGGFSNLCVFLVQLKYIRMPFPCAIVIH